MAPFAVNAAALAEKKRATAEHNRFHFPIGSIVFFFQSFRSPAVPRIVLFLQKYRGQILACTQISCRSEFEICINDNSFPDEPKVH